MTTDTGSRDAVQGTPYGRTPNVFGRFLLAILIAYKRWLSPVLPRACRFTPTCSEYARLAILEYGVLRGIWRAGGRILRCQPLHPGGVDLP